MSELLFGWPGWWGKGARHFWSFAFRKPTSFSPLAFLTQGARDRSSILPQTGPSNLASSLPFTGGSMAAYLGRWLSIHRKNEDIGRFGASGSFFLRVLRGFLASPEFSAALQVRARHARAALCKAWEPTEEIGHFGRHFRDVANNRGRLNVRN